ELVSELCGVLGSADPAAPRVVFLHGPSGMGKTSVARAVERTLRESMLVVRAACEPSEAVAFGGLAGVVDSLSLILSAAPDVTETLDRARLRAVAALCPAFAAVAGEPDVPDMSAPDERKALAIAALRRVLAHLARATPVVVILDDLQWAGADTLELLSILIE